MHYTILCHTTIILIIIYYNIVFCKFHCLGERPPHRPCRRPGRPGCTPARQRGTPAPRRYLCCSCVIHCVGICMIVCCCASCFISMTCCVLLLQFMLLSIPAPRLFQLLVSVGDESLQTVGHGQMGQRQINRVEESPRRLIKTCCCCCCCCCCWYHGLQ